MSYQGGRAFAAPAASVYTTHPDGGFGPGYEGEYVTAPAAPIAGHAKYGSFMQVRRRAHDNGVVFTDWTHAARPRLQRRCCRRAWWARRRQSPWKRIPPPPLCPVRYDPGPVQTVA